MKMTENEAIEKLRAYHKCQRLQVKGIYEDCNEKLCDNCDLCYAQGNTGEHIKSIEIAIQALEKQIPKKPTPIDYEKYIDVIDNARLLRGAYWCPNCKHVVKSGSFCNDCGQKLDWSNEDM